MESVSNVTIDNNWVFHLQKRPVLGETLEPWAGIAHCTMPKRSICSGVSVINNVVAGAVWTGYTAKTHACGESAT
jgi:hypothetical protein